jgi:hypothetical protein
MQERFEICPAIPTDSNINGHQNPVNLLIYGVLCFKVVLAILKKFHKNSSCVLPNRPPEN